jgi:hypothetical protein
MFSRALAPQCLGRRSQTVSLLTRTLHFAAITLSVFCLLPAISYGQTSLPTGTVGVDPPHQCNPSDGWYYYSNGGTNYNMSCVNANVSCSGVFPDVSDLGLTFGYINPAVTPGTGISVPKGVIILHGGDGGIQPESFALTDAYFKAGFEVVQVAWWDDWEMLSDPMTGTGNIQHAACRPATVLNYIWTTYYLPMIAPGGVNNTAAMCALGDSAGSAAIAYSLAYYGAGSWLDNVELLSGPVLSDIEQGCEIPRAGPVTVCSPSSPNQGWGCQLGQGGSTWTLLPEYVAGAQTGVQKWTNEVQACTSSGGTGNSNADWLKESIVDQGTGAAPTFVYSKTSMAGWLCRSVYNRNGVAYNCAATNNGNSNYCPNNSSPQGQIFYQNIPYLTPNFSVYAVDACSNAEGVGAGYVPGYQPLVFGGNVTGITAITDDMVGLPPTIPAMCVRRH